jgi:hypothetical protein
MNKSLDNLYWHDGNLSEIKFGITENGKAELILSAGFYKTQNAPERTSYQIRCEGVSRFSATIDAIELKNNAFAGNIANGYVKENTLWVYFTDGLLEVSAKKIKLVKC